MPSRRPCRISWRAPHASARSWASCSPISIRACRKIEYAIDRDRVKSIGVNLADVFFTLQTFLGNYYVNDFKPVWTHVPGADPGRGQRTRAS